MNRPWALAVVATVALAACGGSLTSDEARAKAITNLTSGADALSQEVAECVVDQFGTDRLEAVDWFSSDFQQRLDATTTDEASDDEIDAGATVLACLTVARSSDDTSDETPVDCTTVEATVCDYGDDEALDALWDACSDGDGAACDDLYYQSEYGTRYEQFGNTCGDRGFALSCEKDLGATG